MQYKTHNNEMHRAVEYKVQSETKRTSQSGTTLFEILLYIALFTILFVGVMQMSIALSKTVEQFHNQIDTSEITLFVYMIALHEVDAENNIYEGQNSMQEIGATMYIKLQRILKFYPNIDIEGLELSLHSSSYSQKQIKIKYTVHIKSNNRNIFKEIYIDML